MRVGILSEYCLAGSHGSGAQMLRIIDHAHLDYFHLYWSLQPFGPSEPGRRSFLFEDPLFWRPVRLSRAMTKLHAALGLRGWRDNTLNVPLFKRLVPAAQLHCDVLYAFATSEGSARRCLSLIDHLKKPFVAHLMDVQHADGLDPAIHPAFAELFRRASSVLVINAAIEKEVRRFPVREVEIVPFGQTIYDLPPRTDVSDDARQVFITGAIHRHGLDLLAQAWPRVLALFPGTELVYTGKHFDAVPAALRPHVRNLGFVAPAQYFETLRRSHIGYVPGPVELDCYGRFSIPSRMADFYMAGLPVIANVATDSAAELFLRPLLGEKFVQIPHTAEELVSQFQTWLGDEPLRRRRRQKRTTLRGNAPLQRARRRARPRAPTGRGAPPGHSVDASNLDTLRMKITFVTHNYAPFTGGIETHAEQMAHALSARGHEVTVAALNFGRFHVPRRLKALDQNLLAKRTGEDRRDGPVRVISLGPRWGQRLQMLPLLLRCTPVLPRWFHSQIDTLTHPFHRWAFGPALARAIRGADVVHSLATFDLGWTAGAVADQLGVPVVCTPFAHPAQWGDGPNDVAFYKRCAAVIGLLGSDRDHLAQLGISPEKLHTIGVSPSVPAPVDPAGARRQAGCQGNEPLILFVGRMTSYKGATSLLAAAPLIWERFPEARFAFIGPGSASETAIFDSADPRIRYLGRSGGANQGRRLWRAATCSPCLPSAKFSPPSTWKLGASANRWLAARPTACRNSSWATAPGSPPNKPPLPSPTPSAACWPTPRWPVNSAKMAGVSWRKNTRSLPSLVRARTSLPSKWSTLPPFRSTVALSPCKTLSRATYSADARSKTPWQQPAN